jgi:hypothetical protein
LKIRPYEGLENWVRWRELRSWIGVSGLEVVDQSGFNALPFVHPLTYPLIDGLDHLGRTRLGRLMINMMFVAEKPTAQLSPA